MRARGLALASLLLTCCRALVGAPASPSPAPSPAPAPSPPAPAAPAPSPLASAAPAASAPAALASSRPSSPPAPALLPDSGAPRQAAAPTPPGSAPEATARTEAIDRINAWVARARPRLRRCYSEELQRNPDLRADPQSWELRIDDKGQVKKATYLCKPPLPPQLDQCLRQAFTSMTFEGASGTISFGPCAAK